MNTLRAGQPTAAVRVVCKWGAMHANEARGPGASRLINVGGDQGEGAMQMSCYANEAVDQQVERTTADDANRSERRTPPPPTPPTHPPTLVLFLPSDRFPIGRAQQTAVRAGDNKKKKRNKRKNPFRANQQTNRKKEMHKQINSWRARYRHTHTHTRTTRIA